jgi:hypothetical protein
MLVLILVCFWIIILFLVHLFLSEFFVHTVYNTNLSLCLISYGVNHEGTWESGGIVLPFLTAALNGVEWSASGPSLFILGTYRIGGWVCPRSGLDSMEKKQILPLSRTEPRLSTMYKSYEITRKNCKR